MSPVPQADAVVDVGAVVVELGHAAVADPAMLGAQGPHDSAGVAETQDVRTAWALPLVVASNLLDGAGGQCYGHHFCRFSKIFGEINSFFS
jgi:hypothetical protein